MLLTIDPGLRGCGVALFDDSGALVAADYVKNPVAGKGYAAHSALGDAVDSWVALRCDQYHPTSLVIEHPRVYPGAPNKDLNDLLDVVAVGAAVGAKLQHTLTRAPETVYPSEWKGTVKKAVMTERIRRALTPDELKVCRFTNKSDDSDLLDAVGIGLWRLGRLNKRVFPGAT